MYEKELKILDINADRVRSLLLAYGAVQRFDGLIDDMYYDSEDNYLRQNGYSCRIRQITPQEGDISFMLCLKQKIKHKTCKVRHEREYAIDNPLSYHHVLESHGLQHIASKQKYRKSYTIGKVVFDIDRYEGREPLLEIEGSKKSIRRRQERLGLSMHETSKKWAWGLGLVERRW